jgi:L-threonylcarbamoyladenylate synthase
MSRVIHVRPDMPDAAAIAEAAERIRAGELVAFATETVYGLGADATSESAVRRIYEAKGRPAFNPLIVHAASTKGAQAYVADWPETAALLATAFWPGPLTLVLPKADSIPDIVTAGRATVGVRVPRPKVARALIAAAGVPIAAPSANRSTGISPTLARHVADDLGEAVALILNSGPTEVGLESTVLDLTTREPRILRPGPITAFELMHALGGLRVREADGDSAAADDAPHASPGQMAVHYAPRTEAIRFEPGTLTDDHTALDGNVGLLVVGPHDPDAPPHRPRHHRIVLAEPIAAAARLYRELHDLDRLGLDRIVVVMPPDRPEWHALRDRLRRATRPQA